MSDSFCMIHGYTMKHDMRSGLEVCQECEAMSDSKSDKPKPARCLHCPYEGALIEKLWDWLCPSCGKCFAKWWIT